MVLFVRQFVFFFLKKEKMNIFFFRFFVCMFFYANLV